MVEFNLPELIRTLGDRVPWKSLVLGGAAILALFAIRRPH
jgi:Na+/citrate or Na+/malate symporter